jgi:hypothetical protein
MHIHRYTTDVRTSVCSVDILQKYVPVYVLWDIGIRTYVHMYPIRSNTTRSVHTTTNFNLFMGNPVCIRMYVRLWVVRHAVVASECYARYHIARPPYEAPNEALDGGR